MWYGALTFERAKRDSADHSQNSEAIYTLNLEAKTWVVKFWKLWWDSLLAPQGHAIVFDFRPHLQFTRIWILHVDLRKKSKKCSPRRKGPFVCAHATVSMKVFTIFEFKFAPVLKEDHLLTIKFLFYWISFHQYFVRPRKKKTVSNWEKL